ncbi:VOC family protein [Natrialbaceae archaeon A-CW3]
MLTDTPGIHHVTGIVRDAQRNLEFYVGTLGLRLVKQTVNHNDVLTRHLFYGDETGSPGTVLTFFPYPAEDPGRVGHPQISAFGLTIPPDSVSYWRERLEAAGIGEEPPTVHERFDETVLQATDPDGTHLELVTGDSPVEPWTDGSIPGRHAIRGIHGVTLLSTNVYVTASVLETLGFELEIQEGDRIRYRAPGDRATVIDLLEHPIEFGREGAGSIHHVAVRVPESEQLYEWHDLFREREYDVSRVVDRHMFHSLYVRDPGGILFELATDGPELTETNTAGGDDTPGRSLSLPPWLEDDRDMIETHLPPLDVSAVLDGEGRGTRSDGRER